MHTIITALIRSFLLIHFRIRDPQRLVDIWQLHCPQQEVDVDQHPPPQTHPLLSLGPQRTRCQVYNALYDALQGWQIPVAWCHVHRQAQFCVWNRRGHVICILECDWLGFGSGHLHTELGSNQVICICIFIHWQNEDNWFEGFESLSTILIIFKREYSLF